jgi:hypothetical protein
MKQAANVLVAFRTGGIVPSASKSEPGIAELRSESTAPGSRAGPVGPTAIGRDRSDPTGPDLAASGDRSVSSSRVSDAGRPGEAGADAMPRGRRSYETARGTG